ncbi:hypothetical protein [Streptomyces flavidovirens]
MARGSGPGSPAGRGRLSVGGALSRYAKCLDGSQEVAKRRVEDLLREYE